MMTKDLEKQPISTLIGKPARVYTTGDMLTQDYVENRVNIELSEKGEIVRIRMG